MAKSGVKAYRRKYLSETGRATYQANTTCGGKAPCFVQASPILPLIVGMIAISFAPILVRYSNAPVSVQGLYRMLFTILIMLPLGRKQLPALRSITKKDWWLLVVAGVFLALHFLLWMESFEFYIDCKLYDYSH